MARQSDDHTSVDDEARLQASADTADPSTGEHTDIVHGHGIIGHTSVDGHPAGVFSLDAHGSVLAQGDDDPLAAASGYDPSHTSRSRITPNPSSHTRHPRQPTHDLTQFTPIHRDNQSWFSKAWDGVSDAGAAAWDRATDAAGTAWDWVVDHRVELISGVTAVAGAAACISTAGTLCLAVAGIGFAARTGATVFWTEGDLRSKGTRIFADAVVTGATLGLGQAVKAGS